jgi:23S rRNA pseudouridine1911/1915/1917 synthase
VHRLDRGTSGVIVIAKDQDTFLHLKKQLHDRTTEKTYHAIVWGAFKDQAGVIDMPIGKSKKDFRQWVASPKARGVLREARTEYSVLAQNDNYAYIEVHPRTGRTHQIRVHLKSIGHPLLCDTLYASGRACPALPGRLALHAAQLVFRGVNNEVLAIEAPLPKDFARALAELGLV